MVMMKALHSFICCQGIWTGPEAKNGNRKYIVALGRYHKLGDGCFMDAPG